MENNKQNLLSPKWIKKYMKLARTLAEDNQACHSRKIGVVLVSNKVNRIVSVGYNGAIEGIPHADSQEYLNHLWNNLLNEDDKYSLGVKYDVGTAEAFCNKFTGCSTCPRKLLNIPSGLRLELCPCAHAERNCLASAGRLGSSTEDSTMYCYCPCPCHECGTQIIQSGVNQVVCLKAENDYSVSTRYNFQFAGVRLLEIDIKDIE